MSVYVLLDADFFQNKLFLFCRNIICNGLSQHNKFSEKRKRAWLSQFLKQRAMSTITIVCIKESLSNQSSSFTFNVS